MERYRPGRQAIVEYEKPEVKDYGELEKLTASAGPGVHIDVPKGTPVPPFSIFS